MAAVEGIYTINEEIWEFKVQDNINYNPTRVDFDAEFVFEPYIFGTVSSANQWDPVILRRSELWDSHAMIYLQEVPFWMFHYSNPPHHHGHGLSFFLFRVNPCDSLILDQRNFLTKQ